MSAPQSFAPSIPPLAHHCQPGRSPGPVVADRARRIGARILLGGYPACPELVAEAIHASAVAMHAAVAPPDAEVARKVRNIVVSALNAAPAEDLMLLQLEFVEDMPVEAIALMTGSSPDNVRRLRARAMARLAGALAGLP